MRPPLLLLIAVVGANPLLAADSTPPSWHDSYDAALAAGLAGRRPILILFDAPTSSSRRKNILPDLDSNPTFAEFSARQLILARIPAPGLSTDAAAERRSRQIRSNHGVGSLPSLVLLDSDGRTLGSPTLRANQSAGELVAVIRSMIPPSLLVAQTNGAPLRPKGPLAIDLSAPTNIPTTSATIDLARMRSEGATPAHPSLIIVPQDTAGATNMLNRRIPN